MTKFFPRVLGTFIAATSILTGQSPEEPTLEVEQGVGSFKWQSQQGRVYFLQFSTDLEEWDYFPSIIEPGNGQEKEWMFSTTPNPKLFTRLKHTQSNSLTPENEDFDSDGYTNFFELQIANSDPLDNSSPQGTSLDFDGDGLPDEFEIENFGSLEYGPEDDPDGDGLNNQQELVGGTNANYDEQGNSGGGAGGGDTFSGTLPIPENEEVMDHTGNGVENNKTEDSEEFSFSEGASSFFVLVGLHSDEYDYYTDPTCTIEVDGNQVPCEFNDKVKYTLSSPETGDGGDEITKELDVNEHDSDWDGSGKDFDVGEGSKFYYFIEQKVLKNPQRKAVDMDSKVEVTNINDGQRPSGATIAVFPVQIQPKSSSAGAVGDLIMSNKGKSGEKHFVSTKKNPHLNDDFVEFKVTGIKKEVFDEFLEWEGGVAGSSSLERKVSRASSEKVPLKVKIKESGEVVDLMNVWITWSDLNGSVKNLKKDPIINPAGLRVGTRINAIYDGIFSITPLNIILDEDRPNLTGKNATPTPGGQVIGNVGYPIGDLKNGATAKWDVSRRIKRDFNLNSNPVLKRSTLDHNISYPNDKIIGNDDYSNNAAQVTSPYTSLGVLNSFDKPHRDFGFQGGGINSTYENDTDFQEFARLEINGKWYLISDDDTWGIHWKFKKVKLTESIWNRDINGDGDKSDDILEQSLGQDVDNDGSVGGELTLWVDDGSSINN